MRRTHVFWIAAAACTVAFFAQAQQVPSPASPPMVPGTSNAPGSTGEGATSVDTVDQDRDGRITHAEAKRHPELARQFRALDRDGDGTLSSAEFARFEIGADTSQTDARSRGGATAESDSDATRDGARTRGRDR